MQMDYFDDYMPTTTKEIKIYRNGDSNLCCQVALRDNIKFNDIRRLLQQKWDTHFNQLRLFNSEGVEQSEDDLEFIKNGTVLFASKGEEFDESFQLAEYEIIEDIGEGGFGKVSLGKHKQTGEKVAIKQVKGAITNAQDVEGIFREARALKSLRHDHIVKIYNAFFLQNLQTVYIMEYLEGGELLAKVQDVGHFSEDEARHYFKQIVSAISYCHQKKIIHRDLKLENLLLTSKDSKEAKVIDFGISGFASNDNPENADAGSLKYMAPELLIGMDKAVSPLVDVWAMGIILYGMLVGQLPFSGNSNKEIIQQIQEGRVHIPPEIVGKLSPICLDCLYKCLEPDPKKRISSIELLNHKFCTDEQYLQIKIPQVEKMKQEEKVEKVQLNNQNKKKQNVQFAKPTIGGSQTPAQKKSVGYNSPVSISNYSKTPTSQKTYGKFSKK